LHAQFRRTGNTEPPCTRKIFRETRKRCIIENGATVHAVSRVARKMLGLCARTIYRNARKMRPRARTISMDASKETPSLSAHNFQGRGKIVRPCARSFQGKSKMERSCTRKISSGERKKTPFSARTLSRDTRKHGVHVNAQFPRTHAKYSPCARTIFRDLRVMVRLCTHNFQGRMQNPRSARKISGDARKKRLQIQT
jgi:hypothetical protein